MSQTLFLISIISLGVASRILPHPANFTPIGAIALFSGFYFRNRNFALVPLLSMAVSDLLISGYYGPVMFYVYGSFLAIFLLGRLSLRTRSPSSHLFAASLAGSLFFFVVTNFAVWLHGSMYAKDLNGLLAGYLAALPFFRHTLLSDLFYNLTFFSALKLPAVFAAQKNPSPRV